MDSENSVDLDNLSIGLFLPPSALFHDIERRNGEKEIMVRWRYVAKFYPWLVAEPIFAERFFKQYFIERDLYPVLFSLVDNGKLSIEDIDDFTSSLSIEWISNIVAFSRNQDVVEHVVENLIERENIDSLIESLKNSSFEWPGILERKLLSYFLRLDLVEDTKKIIGFFVETNFTASVVSILIEFLPESEKWFDFLYTFYIGRTQDFYMLIFKNEIFVHNTLFPAKQETVLSRMVAVISFLSKRAGKTMEEFFYLFAEIIPSVITGVNNRMVINDGKVVFYQAIYSLGVTYQVLSEYGTKTNDPAFLEWSKKLDV